MNHLAVAVLGEDKPEVVEGVTRLAAECKCDILDSRIMLLGECYGMVLLIRGNWNTLTRLESQLQKLERRLGLQLLLRRTEDFREQPDLRPYAVEVNALDQAGAVARLVEFFGRHGVPVEELSTRRYRVPHTGTPMLTLNLTVGVPGRVHIGTLRDEFLDFCDECNWDAVLEPLKS
ncbi:MAG: ACT domain-containing protein [Candidatus Competibacterales bacterium]|nr:ACT domain-containing protein [Candidatus Competibacterales bacterium]